MWLRKSFRFAADSGIGRLAAAVRAGDARAALALLEGSETGELRWHEEACVALPETSRAALWAAYQPYWQAVQQGADATTVFAAFARVRILCAQRRGARGVEGINQWIERLCHPQGARASASPWYAGRPVMILKNDAALRLFNGDIGLTLPDETGQLRVYFQEAEGGRLRALSPLRLPAHESAFALTIHKSQGSEFDTVITVLPEAPSALTCRELLYTAVTRARAQLLLIGPKTVLAQAIGEPSQRHSGLVARLGSGGQY